MFAQINDGNAVALPFAKGFGWGAELNLTYMFEQLFSGESGQGYPKERVIPEQRNKKILDEVKKVTYVDMTEILKFQLVHMSTAPYLLLYTFHSYKQYVPLVLLPFSVEAVVEY